MYSTLTQWLPEGRELGLTAWLSLSLVFFVASFILVPRTFLCIAVGAVYGLPAICVILPSTTLGGILAFLAARYLFSARVQAFIETRHMLRRIAVAVDEEGWRLLAVMRFASPIPNAVQNYLFALTGIRLLPFAIVSFVFTVPQIALYVYLGFVGRAALMDDGRSILDRVLLGLGCISIAVAALLIARRVRHNSIDATIVKLTNRWDCG